MGCLTWQHPPGGRCGGFRELGCRALGTPPRLTVYECEVMDSFTVGWIMGALTGGLFGFMLALTIVHWKNRPRRKLDMDERWQAVKKL